MKIGNLNVKSQCVMCGSDIKNLKYAIRDSHVENYSMWLTRHLKSLFSFGLKRPNPKLFLPLCSGCVRKLRK